MKLSRRVRNFIEKCGIKLIISEKADDMDEFAGAPKEIVDQTWGLFIWDIDNITSDKKIWLKSTCPDMDYTALHELGHYITIKSYSNKTIRKYDPETLEHVDELLAEGAALALCYVLGIKPKRGALQQLREDIKSIKIRSK
jgi:hypothetical protein